MKLGELFSNDNRTRSQAAQGTFARFELLRSAVQFLAALCFLGGSVALTARDPQQLSSWLYIAGSVLFCAVPAVRLWSELVLYRMGHTETLAERSIALSPGQLERRRRRAKRKGE
ncbi:YrhK family protein [Melaminivora suipulveris]|uniref:YrhK family protein n=1 Tax=Melaminivora suipulveris TaxID=2109913 RepID=UPI00131A5C99|nr:YrhK family protein [Melaminivora suipulveris]